MWNLTDFLENIEYSNQRYDGTESDLEYFLTHSYEKKLSGTVYVFLCKLHLVD
jgi:hypothetical protein